MRNSPSVVAAASLTRPLPTYPSSDSDDEECYVLYLSNCDNNNHILQLIPLSRCVQQQVDLPPRA
eukprot:1022421-Prorocentrum_minimum.AAC.1